MTSQAAGTGARAIGERPVPDLPEGTDTLPQVDHILPYLLAATSVGMVDDILPETIVPPPNGTIYDLLDAHQISWRNYYSTFPATSYRPRDQSRPAR
jgi:hypothetical protein